MTLLAGLLALGAMVAFGIAAVLQGVASARTRDSGGIDPRLLLALSREPAFLGSLALNILGFAMHVTALQSLPLFLVQAVIAGSVAVTAVLSVRVFHTPLVRAQWVAVALVVLGLALLAPSATSGAAADVSAAAPLLLLGVVVAVALLAVVAGRARGSVAAVLLGLLAGTGFGVVALCARLLPAGLALLASPTFAVLGLAGVTAFLLYSVAMQRGSVTTTTAAMVITQTAVPALVGVLLLGDRVRPGFLPLAVAGFGLALAGAVGLGRYERGLAPVG